MSSAAATTFAPSQHFTMGGGFTQGYGHDRQQAYLGDIGPAAMAMPDVSSVSLTAASLSSIAGAAIYGGLVGGVSAAGWQGAATGAGLAAGLSSLGYGTAFMLGGMATPGLLLGAAGIGGLVWAGIRWNKRRK